MSSERNNKIKIIAITFLLILNAMSSFAQWEFLGEPDPEYSLKVFAPTEVSTMKYERDMAISADGTEMYYSIQRGTSGAYIYFRKYSNGTWSLPEVASFSGTHWDIEPFFSPFDGKLFFSSNRGGNFDIYYVERGANGNWGNPVNAGATINTSADEYYPSVDIYGTLYWTANYPNGLGDEDIWFATKSGDGYSQAQGLPEGVNSEYDEFNAFVGPQGDYIIFSIWGKPGDMGGGDLYVSRKVNGEWGAATQMHINSPQLDYSPFVYNDEYLFFTSLRLINNRMEGNIFNPKDVVNFINAPGNGNGDIYWIRFK